MIPYFLLKPQKERKKKKTQFISLFLRSLVFFCYEYSFKINFSVSFFPCIPIIYFSSLGVVLATSIFLLFSSEQNTLLCVPDVLFTSETSCEMVLSF